tara:strand:- start:468 stop:641 length:174 start_codon:yes stop_codon:yes gene_type:complete
MGRVYLGSIYKYKLQDKVLEKKLKKMKKRLDSYGILSLYLVEMRNQITKKGKKSYDR